MNFLDIGPTTNNGSNFMRESGMSYVTFVQYNVLTLQIFKIGFGICGMSRHKVGLCSSGGSRRIN